MGVSIRFRTWHAAAFLGGVSAVSALSSSKDARAYWRGLNRPTQAPPAWVFPAAWTGLNMLQLWADLRILNRPEVEDRNALIGLRVMSWVLYALLTPTGFRAGSHLPGGVVTLAEGVTAGAAVALLAKSDPIGAAALTALPLWTAYASLFAPDAAPAIPDSLVDRLRWQGAF